MIKRSCGKGVTSRKGFGRINWILTVTTFFSLILLFKCLSYSRNAADSAVLSLTFFLIELAITVFPIICSGENTRIPQILKLYNIHIRIAAIIFNTLFIMLFLYPRSRPPEIYGIALVPHSFGSEPVYNIEVEANLTTNSIIIYDNNSTLEEISQYQVSGNKHLFTTTIEMVSFEMGHTITAGILLPSGEIIKTDASAPIPPPLSVLATCAPTPDPAGSATISALTSFQASKVTLTYSSSAKSYGTHHMTSIDNMNWAYNIQFEDEAAYTITIVAYTNDGLTATDTLIVTYPFADSPQEPQAPLSPNSPEVSNPSDSTGSNNHNSHPPSASDPSGYDDSGESTPDNSNANDSLTVAASCIPIRNAEDLLDFYGLTDLAELSGVLDSLALTSVSNLNAIIVADTSFEATRVTLDSSSQTTSYGRESMTSSNGRQWKFAANFFEESTFTIVVTAYAPDGQEATTTLTVTYPFS